MPPDDYLPIVLVALILMVVTGMITFAAAASWAWKVGYAECDEVRHRIVEDFRRSDDARIREIKTLTEANVNLARQLEEARSMARKPLTEDQLKACLDAGGEACPRCGNDDGDQLTFGAMEDDDDGRGPYQAVRCDDCSESWIVRFRVVKVEPPED